MRAPALALLAATLAACSISRDGAIQADWLITDGGAQSSCEIVGAATVQVVATRVATGVQFTAPFACGSYAGEIDGLRPGRYTVTVELLDPAGQMLSQAPASFDVYVASGDVAALPQSVEFAFQANSFISLSWVVTQGGEPATCADVNAASVSVTSTPQDGGEPYVDNFSSCDAGAGKTDPLPAGAYVVTVSVLDADGNLLATGMSEPITLAKGATYDLGQVEFAF